MAALGALALRRGDCRLATRLLGAAAATRDRIGLLPWPTVCEWERRKGDRLKALMPGDAFNGMLESGRSLTIVDALAEARLVGALP